MNSKNCRRSIFLSSAGIYIIMNFRLWYLFESQMEVQAQALRILNNDQNTLNQIIPLDPTPTKKYLPIIAFFFKQGNKPVQLHQYFEKYKQLEDDKRIKPLQARKDGVYYDNKLINFLQFTELVDGVFNLQKAKAGKNDGMPIDAKPIMSKNGIDIYEANSPQACVKYGQGYSFCISKPGGTMWQSYRDMQVSTFYFVFDRNLDKSDPLHIVVVDMTNDGLSLTDANNTTGNIAKFGSNANAYLKYLEEKGIPSSIFKNIPRTSQERDESELLGQQEFDLDWFKNLSHDYKSKYIGRGHTLSKPQFKYLWDNKAFDLIHQYITTGRRLENSELDLVETNKQLKRSYLQTRVNAEGNERVSAREYSMMDDAQKAKITNFDLILRDAARTGDMDLIQLALPRANDHSVLSNAAQGGNTAAFRYILSNIPNAVIKTHDMIAALDEAASKGHIDIIKSILEYLHKTGTVKMYSFAIEVGALKNAAANGHIDIVRLLIPYINNATAALGQAASHGYIDIVKLLSTYVNDIDISKGDGSISPFTSAAANGHTDIVKLLMSRVKDFDNAAKYAAFNGHIDIVKLLMPKLGVESMTRVMATAAIKGHTGIVQLLLNNADKIGQALYYAAVNNHIDIVKMLLNDPKIAYVPITEFNKAIQNATTHNYSGREEVVQLLKSYIDNHRGQR